MSWRRVYIAAVAGALVGFVLGWSGGLHLGESRPIQRQRDER